MNGHAQKGRQDVRVDSSAASLRQEAADWLEFFRESANPQTAAERWVYLDEAAVLVERLLAEEAESK